MKMNQLKVLLSMSNKQTNKTHEIAWQKTLPSYCFISMECWTEIESNWKSCTWKWMMFHLLIIDASVFIIIIIDGRWHLAKLKFFLTFLRIFIRFSLDFLCLKLCDSQFQHESRDTINEKFYCKAIASVSTFSFSLSSITIFSFSRRLHLFT